MLEGSEGEVDVDSGCLSLLVVEGRRKQEASGPKGQQKLMGALIG